MNTLVKFQFYFALLCALVFTNSTLAQIEINQSTTLQQDVNTYIVITADSITLDLNEYSVYGSGQPFGILISNKTGVTVMNGTVDNCQYGIYVDNSDWVFITEIMATSCDYGFSARNGSWNEFDNCIAWISNKD